jgi:hypothetical protein
MVAIKVALDLMCSPEKLHGSAAKGISCNGMKVPVWSMLTHVPVSLLYPSQLLWFPSLFPSV